MNEIIRPKEIFQKEIISIKANIRPPKRNKSNIEFILLVIHDHKTSILVDLEYLLQAPCNLRYELVLGSFRNAIGINIFKYFWRGREFSDRLS